MTKKSWVLTPIKDRQIDKQTSKDRDIKYESKQRQTDRQTSRDRQTEK